MWPFRRRRRVKADIASEMDRGKLEIQKLKIDVAKQIAADDPRTAAVLLWGNSRGAAQTLTGREPSLAERYLEAKLLRDSDDDGFDRLLKLRQLAREEREEMGSEHESGLAQAVERFGPTVLAGLAGMLNPAGYQQALVAQIQQQQAAALAAGQPPVPPPGGSNAGMVVAPVPNTTVSGAVPGTPELDEPEPESQQETTGDVINFPGLRPSVVLANLDSMPPAVFAHWALEQPVLGEQLRALSQQSDEQIWKSLEIAAANPLAGGFRAVFEWLRQHPQQAEAIVQAMRAMTVQLDADDDVAI